MSEIKIPKFVADFANYLVAIRNLSQVYIKKYDCYNRTVFRIY